MWKATSSWQFRNPEANEPSDVSYALTRLGGIFTILISIGLVGAILEAEEARSDSQATPRSARGYNPWGTTDQETGDGLSPVTVQVDPVDPFSSAADSPVATGDPVTLFTPVLQSDSSGGEESEESSARPVGIEAVYYPWTSGDHPAAFAAATVIDSRTALGTLDLSQATTPEAGESTLGDSTYIIVRLTRPVCAISSVSARTNTSTNKIEISVEGVSDVTRCGQSTEGAYVAVPLSDEQVALAQSYEESSYRPLETAAPSQRYRYGGMAGGDYDPTPFVSRSRSNEIGIWKDPETDKQLNSHVLVPWLPTTQEPQPTGSAS